MDKYNEALEKAKAYDEALGLMRDCVPDEDGLVHVRPSDIFPELTKNKDEKIRKEILEYFQQFENEELRGVNISDWIAWLEKLKVFAEHGDGLYHFGNNVFTYVGNPTWDNVSWLEKQGQKKYIDDLTQQEAMDIAVAKCFEQGGQKPVDKVEPKFNIGDWVVNKNGTVQQILSYKNGIYKHTNGYSSKMFEDEWRLWDITKDVKDGDVLADEYGIYIFNSCDSLDDKLFICKCAYEYSKKAFEIGGMLCKKTDVYPASREQRDLLFQKMHEEGYEWNAEKKEVMKIGQKPTEWKQENREELTEFENAMMHIGGSFFGENAGLDPNDTDTIKEQAELLLELAPKTEWSEEDRTMAFTLMRDVDQMSYVSKEGKNERIVWLNSLDEKFASTESAWSEEDEGFLNLLLAIFTNEHPNGVFSTDGITVFKGNCVTSNRIITWLKSLKPQKQWKPSREQMYMLEWLTTNVLDNGVVGNKAKEVLNTLIGQLKSL